MREPPIVTNWLAVFHIIRTARIARLYSRVSPAGLRLERCERYLARLSNGRLTQPSQGFFIERVEVKTLKTAAHSIKIVPVFDMPATLPVKNTRRIAIDRICVQYAQTVPHLMRKDIYEI